MRVESQVTGVDCRRTVRATAETHICHTTVKVASAMAYAGNMDDELGGLDINELPPELQEVQEEARQERQSQGGYRFNSVADRAHIKAQRGAIWAWLRGLGGNLIKHGVNLTKVPLPVELCEPRSFLQRLTDSWAYLDMLHAAAQATDPAERMKLVVAFVVGGMRQQVSCDKPFNPILGETLQGVYPCGCEVYAEQISHHPPVSCWQVRDEAGKFEFTGSSCWSATFSGNNVKGSQSGESRVRFASDGATVTWTLPCIIIRGVLFGERVVKYQDTIVFKDDRNNLECVLHIEPHGPKRGLVKRVLHKARHPRSKGTKHDQLLGEVLHLPAPGSKKSPVVLDTCGGTWLTDLTWDKGVRSTVLPESFDPAAAAAAAAKSAAAAKTAAAAAAAAAAAEDAGDTGSVVCHSIGSFSTTSGSTVGDVEQGEGSADDVQHPEGMNGHSSLFKHQPCMHPSKENGQLTAAALAAHTSFATPQTAHLAPGHGVQQLAGCSAAAGAGRDVICNGSSAALSSSDATGHRSGKGISVVKQLWAPHISMVYQLQRLCDEDPQLLPSDCRYRPDVCALAAGNNQAAQRWKLVLEQKQRADRNLRGNTSQGQHSKGGGEENKHRHSSSRGSDHLAGDEQHIGIIRG